MVFEFVIQGGPLKSVTYCFVVNFKNIEAIFDDCPKCSIPFCSTFSPLSRQILMILPVRGTTQPLQATSVLSCRACTTLAL